MKVKTKLIRLTLLGHRKNYIVNFRDGFNLISGHTSTGKTSILEMIDYALGSNSHKSYIEIGNSCSDVVLELQIDNEKLKIKRKLFDFKSAVIVEIWNVEKKKYLFYNRCEIDAPSNPKSLSAFLNEKLGLADITISGQSFSFRDLYKYAYLKQTQIDNEDILGEKAWEKNFKRKATFEIIFNMYDKTLDGYKISLDKKKEEQNELKIKLSGINEFLSSVDLISSDDQNMRSNNLISEIIDLQKDLSEIKKDKGINNEPSNRLREKVKTTKLTLQTVIEEKNDQQRYIDKLKLLYNQYLSEIEKKEMAIEGYLIFNEYEFVFCPNCLKPIHKSYSIEVCSICGNEKSEDKSELVILKKEIATTKRKANELLKFIDSEDRKYDDIINKENYIKNTLKEAELELQHLYKDYVNPHIEQIEYLNYEIGQKNRLLNEMKQYSRMFDEVERIERQIKDKDISINYIKENIKILTQDVTDKEDLIGKLSSKFTTILEGFKYPKLDNSYIDIKNYLPYVRGRKYDDIGSLAGVTLITMAYYLSILLEGSNEKCNNLNFLIIDSPRKNLGAQASQNEQEEFKDEKIFNAIISYLYKTAESNKDKMQLIVVNNGHPDFIPTECIIAEFNSDGLNGLPIGLIDDAI